MTVRTQAQQSKLDELWNRLDRPEDVEFLRAARKIMRKIGRRHFVDMIDYQKEFDDFIRETDELDAEYERAKAGH